MSGTSTYMTFILCHLILDIIIPTLRGLTWGSEIHDNITGK